jgi:hypothetical protein
MQQILGLAIGMIIAREALAGAMRYTLDRFHLGPVWFLIDLALFAAVALVVLNQLMKKPQDRYLYALLAVTFFIGAGVLSGTANGNNTTSIVSAVKIAMPLVATVLVYPHFLRHRWFRACLAGLFVVAVVGVVYNRSHAMPWTGYAYEQFGVTRAAAREWWIDGQSRVSGFGASSAASANIILLMALLLTRGTLRAPLKLAVYGAAFVAIYLTTSRTALLALMLAVTFDLFPRRLVKAFHLGSAEVLAGFFLLATMAPIAWSMVVVFSDGITRYDVSILDRLNYTWPTMLGLSYDHGWASFLFGQGFGSVGSPAHYSGKYVSPISAVDNFMIYMFSLFGVMSLVLALLIFLAFLAIPWRERYFAFAACMMMATISCEGIGGSLLLGFSIAFGLGALGAQRAAAPVPQAAPPRYGRPA